MLNQTVHNTSRLRRILADERGVNVVEYVAVSGIAMLVAGLIIVAMMNSRGQIGRVMAQVHARQVASFEGGGGGGSININAALTPRAPVPTIPQAAWPTLAIPGIVIEAPTIGAPPITAPTMPQPPIPRAAPVAMPVVGLPALFTAFGGDSGAGMATLVAGATTAALAAFAVYSRTMAASTTSAVPAWLAALGKVLLGVVIGVVVLAALAALIYFGAAALAAIGIGAGMTFAAALVIAGVVLAVGFTLFEFWTRLQEFRAVNGEPGFWDYLKIGGVSVLSLTGIPQIIEAIRGTRLLTGVPLSAQQRWELGIGGVLQLALVAVGVRAFWRRFQATRLRPTQPQPAPPPAPVTLGSRVASEGQRVRGNFPRTANPNEILYRADTNGNITHYQVYGNDGLPVMRVDITGRAHGGVPTPHVVEFQRNIAPDGTIFVRPNNTVRPALPDELP